MFLGSRNYGEGRIGKSVPRIALWHHEACRVMTNKDAEGQIFLSYTHMNIGFNFLLTTVSLFKNKLPEVPEYAKIQFHMMTSLNVAMTSLDDNVCEFQYNQCILPSYYSLGKIAWVR